MADEFVTTEQLVDRDQAGFLAAVRQLELDRNRREPEASRVEVIQHPAGVAVTTDLVPPGTVTLFMAEQGSAFLQRVRDAYGSGDPDAVASLAAGAVEGASGRQRLSFAQAARSLTTGRPYGDLRYRGKTLAECLGLPGDVDYGVLPMPYVGGELDHDQFTFVNFRSPATRRSRQELDVLVVVRPPELSDAEREIIDRKRAEVGDMLVADEMLVGTANAVAITITTVTIALFVVAVHTPTLTAGSVLPETISARFDRATALADEKIRALGPAATVGDLMEARAEALSRSF